MLRLAPTLTAALLPWWVVGDLPAGRKHFRRHECDHAKGKKENNFCVVFDCDEQGSDTPRRTKAFVES